MEKEQDYKIDNKIKENRGKIIFIALALIASLIALFSTKNFVYFIFTILLFISIYSIINAKSNKSKRRIAMISYITSGIISALCIFSYFYSKWILPFTLDIMHLPAFEVTESIDSLNKVGNVFGIIGLVFLTITITFLITWYVIRKKEEKEITEKNDRDE